MEFGDAVRNRRSELGLSQAELADRSGASKAMVSEIETGKKNPTLRVACSIAQALECQISDLLDLPPVVRFSKLDEASRRVMVDPENGVERHVLSPPMVRHGVQVLMFVLPGGSSSAFCLDGRGVLEHVTCVAGRVRVWCGEEEAELGEGESANYEPSLDHGFENLDDGGEARVLVVIDMTRRGEAAPLE